MNTPVLPPGLLGDVEGYVEGGSEHDWQPYTQTRRYTNSFIICHDKVGSLDLSGYVPFCLDSTP